MMLYFIRHGQTDWNVLGKIQGSHDSELNQNGILQAKDLSNKIMEENIKFSKIYSSKQKRAISTAEILSEVTSVEYEPWDGLEEINLGDWEGLSWKEVKENFPKEYGMWYENRRLVKSPGGESYQDMLDRVLQAIYEIITMSRDNVAIVTHSAVIMCLQCYITDTPFEEMGKFKTDNANITEIDSSIFVLKSKDKY